MPVCQRICSRDHYVEKVLDTKAAGLLEFIP